MTIKTATNICRLSEDGSSEVVVVVEIFISNYLKPRLL